MLDVLTALSPLSAIEHFEHFVLSNPRRARTFLTHIHPQLLENISQKKALASFRLASRHTPAYQKFLIRHHLDSESITSLADFSHLIPATDKDNYIRSYPYQSRCLLGHLPAHGNIDESGGTTGIATNWIHNLDEQSALLNAVKFEFDYVFDGQNKDYVVISAWSSGPWATGVKFCELMEKLALVKNTSTDSRDILNTLRLFGSHRNYLIGAYPPFIKTLIESNPRFPWKKYSLDLVIGGEGVTLDWIYYLRQKLRPGAKIVSSYGASDIDIGVGFETPFAFFIREQLSRNPDICYSLFGHHEPPMIFQYNPCMHFIENIITSNGQQEFAITLLDPHAALPKIRYNLHDEGRRFSYLDMLNILKSHFPRAYHNYFALNSPNILHLPFLAVFGRTDGTLSFDGANVFPAQIDRAIIKCRPLSTITNRFKMEKRYDSRHNVEFHIHIELKPTAKKSSTLNRTYLRSIIAELTSSNPDFKESLAHNPSLTPHITIHPFGHPIFSQDDSKVKNIYILSR